MLDVWNDEWGTKEEEEFIFGRVLYNAYIWSGMTTHFLIDCNALTQVCVLW